ncbi:MAG: hypothetical protein MHM6MM_003513 [Cercozoa sp. M6MM]
MAPIHVMVMGDRSGVGKSTVTLAVLQALLTEYDASEVAYIKPCTQCVTPTRVTRFCCSKKIKCRGIGPVVFHRGYSHRAIAQLEDESNDGWTHRMTEVVDSIRQVGRDKKVVLIDGVGYPTVGTCCGVSNAAVAKAVDAKVLLVGRDGVGDAIDMLTLTLTYLRAQECDVLGVIFNNSKEPSGRHTYEQCRRFVSLFFAKHDSTLRIFGHLPFLQLGDSEERSCTLFREEKRAEFETSVATTPLMPGEEAHATALWQHFAEHVNAASLLRLISSDAN